MVPKRQNVKASAVAEKDRLTIYLRPAATDKLRRMTNALKRARVKTAGAEGRSVSDSAVVERLIDLADEAEILALFVIAKARSR